MKRKKDKRDKAESKNRRKNITPEDRRNYEAFGRA